jgi:hypothetical protein
MGVFTICNLRKFSPFHFFTAPTLSNSNSKNIKDCLPITNLILAW